MWLVIIIFTVVVVYLYVPIPKGATEPWKLWITSLITQIHSDLVTIYSFIRRRQTHEVMRESMNSLTIRSQTAVEGIEETVDNFDGVEVRMFRPTTASSTPLPGFVFMHGGGWCLLNTKAYSRLTAMFSLKTNSVVVSIEYRLAPEHVFPAAFDDCLTATRYFINNANKYGVNPSKIGLGGDSAGGNLSMAVSLVLSNDEKQPLKHKPTFLVLIYPCLQAFDFDLPSYKEFNYDRNKYSCISRYNMINFNILYAFGNYDNFKAFANNRHVTCEMRKKYRNRVNPNLVGERYSTKLNDDVEADDIDFAQTAANIIFDTRFAPLMASDEQLSKLPPTFLLTCEYDPLRDDGLILNERLKAIKHPVTHVHLPGSEHGVLSMSHYKVNEISIETISNYIKAQINV